LPRSFSLITFSYNEAELIESQIRKWSEQLKKYASDFEVILVDDASNDGTPEIIERLKKDILQLITVRHDKNLGVGYAVRTAQRYLTKDYVFWNDIDGHFNLDDLGKVIPLLNKYDVVVAFKENYRSLRNFSFSWLKSRINYYLIKFLFLSGIKDFQFVQFFPREFFTKGLVLESRSSFIPAECIFKAQEAGLSITQIPLYRHSCHTPTRPSKCMTLRAILESIRDITFFWFKWNFLWGKQKAKLLYHKRLGSQKPWRE
jgi:glycosyltransferase involved in cell wall biosynthesis